MPTISISGISKTFNNIYYVDATKGSNTNPGTESAPFLTVAYAITKCANSGDCIFAKEGRHITTRIAGAYDSGGLSDEGKAITFVGESGKTTFVCDGRLHNGRDSHCIMFQNENTEAYHIIFDFYTNNRMTNYSCAIVSRDAGSAVRGKVYNCVFKMNVNTASLTYANSQKCTVEFHNCLFIAPKNFVNSYSGDGALLSQCACTYAFAPGNKKSNVYEKVSYNKITYEILSDTVNTNSGVMSGKYPWEYFLKVFLLKSQGRIYWDHDTNTLMESYEMKKEDFHFHGAKKKENKTYSSKIYRANKDPFDTSQKPSIIKFE